MEKVGLIELICNCFVEVGVNTLKNASFWAVLYLLLCGVVPCLARAVFIWLSVFSFLKCSYPYALIDKQVNNILGLRSTFHKE